MGERVCGSCGGLGVVARKGMRRNVTDNPWAGSPVIPCPRCATPGGATDGE